MKKIIEWKAKRSLILGESRVSITNIIFCSFLIIRVVKLRAQNAKMNCPFVSNAGTILEPKRTITDV